MRSRYALVVSALSLLAAVSLQTSAHSQSSLPDGWDSLPADQFVDLADTVLDGQPSAEDVQALTDHAWNTFLGDAQFVASGDWATLQVLASDFGRRWTPDANGATPAEVAAFRTALSDRIANEPVAGDTFETLATSDELLASAGAERAALTNRAASWMQQADWQTLGYTDQTRLVNLLHAEQVPTSAFSVRWTGQIVAATTGDYTFGQARQGFVDGALKVQVGGTVVLDTPASRRGERVTGDIEGDSVQLQAGTATPIVIEFVYDARNAADVIDTGLLFPAALLNWREGTQAATLVPDSAFQTVTDGGETTPGLAAEYFADTAFGQLVARRVDSSPQRIWSQWDVLSEQQARKIEAARHAAAELASGTALANVEDVDAFVCHELHPLLRHLPIADRRSIAQRLTRDRQVLGQLSPFAIRCIMPHLFMLPDDDLKDLYAAWLEEGTAPPTQIAYYPGHFDGSFCALAYDDYGWVGHFLRKGNWSVAEELLEEQLARPDGSCNLLTVYCLAHAALMEGKIDELLAEVQARVDDETLSGDAKATWLLGRAHIAEIATGSQPRPGLGRPFVEEAILLASDSDVKFRMMAELAARLGSVGRLEEVQALAEMAAQQFPARGADINEWVSKTDQLVQQYDAATAAVEVEARRNMATALEERIAALEAVGNSSQADRLRARLQAIRANQDNSQ